MEHKSANPGRRYKMLVLTRHLRPILILLLLASSQNKMNFVNATVDKIANFTTDNELTENSTKAKIIEQFKNNWAVKEWTNGYFSEEYIYEINIYWLQFSPPSTTSFFILGILYSFIMAVGVFGNCLVIFMFARCKILRTPANYLVVNLAVSDGLMLIKMPVFIYNCFHKGPILGDIACRLYGFLGGLTGTVSIGTLAAISLDRYCVIRYPLSTKYSKIRVNLCLICSWIYGLSFSLIPFLNIGLGKYQYEGYLTSCSFDYLTENEATKIFILVFFCAAWVIPFCLIAFSYFKIVQVVGRSSWSGSGKRESFRHIKEEDARKQEIKLAVMVLLVIFLWFISWTPYAIVALLGIFGQKHLITPLGSMIPALFCKLTSAADPYMYAVSHPKFRKELLKMFRMDQKKTTKTNKVWHTEKKLAGLKRHGPKDYFDDGVEEEVVEIELKSVNLDEPSIENEFKANNLEKEGQKFQRRASCASVLCLNPSFSNQTSSFRRLSRKLSSFSNSKEDIGKESKI